MLDDHAIDFVVLARYMQILSADFVGRYPERIINIHHSFLPAFAGGKPYHQAYERGVKLIGATSHYVTAQLDEGPIIAQSTLPVDHRDTIESLARKGADLERTVLARAVRLHVEDKILVTGNKTVVLSDRLDSNTQRFVLAQIDFETRSSPHQMAPESLSTAGEGARRYILRAACA